MTVDVYWSICSRSIDPRWPGDIIDHWNVDTEVTKLLHEVVHVAGIREGDIIETCTVLVLRLEQNYWAA